MKITFLNAVVGQNGGSRVIAIYAEKLLKAGHDVTVVSRRPEVKSVARKAVDRYRGRPTTDPNRTAFFDFLGDRHVQIPWKFPIEAADVPDADMIIATWWRTAFEVASLPPQKGKKVYFVQHHEVHSHQPWDLAGGSYWLPLKKVTIADWLVETMDTIYDDQDVIKVENSVDTDMFHAPERQQGTPQRVGLLYATTPFKGVDLSFKAIEKARAKFPDLEVMAFGLQDPSPDLPLPAGTKFYKRPDQKLLRDLYASCDVWLCGSRAEGFHLPPLEAMACRTPVVAARVGGTTEVVKDGINGYLVPTNDAEALGDRLIEMLCKSPKDWRAMSDAAYARAHSYTWDDAGAAFEAALLTFAERD